MNAAIKHTHQIKLLFISFIAIYLSACAAINADSTQPITVLAVCAGSNTPVKAECTLRNDEGIKKINSPGVVSVRRSSSNLNISCIKENKSSGKSGLESKADEKILGNILVGGIIGAVVDLGSGAAFDYPSTVRVLLNCEN